MKEEIGMWVKQANVDLDAAESNLNAEIYYAAAFFAQQCAEKMLKAVCIKKFKQLIKVHDLVFLSRKAGAPQELVKECKFLTRAYIESRYPSDIRIPSENFSKADAEKSIRIAKEVVQWAKEQL